MCVGMLQHGSGREVSESPPKESMVQPATTTRRQKKSSKCRFQRQQLRRENSSPWTSCDSLATLRDTHAVAACP